MYTTTPLATLLALAPLILAKTGLSGCTSSTAIVNGGASIIYYVPGSGEICAPLDCGGGRNAPISTVPGCAAYSGTASYIPSYLPATPTASGSNLLSGMGPGPVQTGWTGVSGSWTTSTTSTASLTETTSTLEVPTNGTFAAPTLVTSSLIFDTSAESKPPSHLFTVASATATATTNAANVARSGPQVLVALAGAAAGFALS